MHRTSRARPPRVFGGRRLTLAMVVILGLLPLLAAPPAAAAVAALLRPDGTPAGWNVYPSGTAAAALDDLVTQPTPVPSTDGIYASVAGRSTEVTFGDVPLAPAGASAVWFYANTGAGTQLSVEVVSGGHTLAATTVEPSQGFGWRSVAVTPSSTAVVDDLRVRFTAVDGGDANVRAAYAAISHTGGTSIVRTDGSPGAFTVQPAGTSPATALDDAVVQPAAVDVTDYLYGSAAGHGVELTLGTASLSGQPGRSSTAYVYANTGADTRLRIQVVSRGETLSGITVAASQGFRWHAVTFVPRDQASTDDLRLRLTALDGGDTNVRAAYVDLTTPHQASPVSVVGPGEVVRPTQRVTGTPGATLVAARNEFESFQVVVQAGAVPLEVTDLRVETALSGPGGTIPTGNVTVYREADYQVSTPSDGRGATGRWRDALIPAVDPLYRQTRKAFPWTVPANENLVAWVDVLVPQSAAAGRYEGSLRVTAGGSTYSVPVALTVLNHTLPSTTTLDSAFRIGGNAARSCNALYGSAACPGGSENRWRAGHLMAVTALNNRMGIANPAAGTPEGSQTALFRKYVSPLVGGAVADPDLPAPRLPGAQLTAFEIRHRDGKLGTWAAQAGTLGYGDEAFLYACDEPEYPARNGDYSVWVECEQGVATAAAQWPTLPTMVTASVQGTQEHDTARDPDLLNGLDILTVLINQLHGAPDDLKYAGNQRAAYNGWLAAPAAANDPANRLWVYTACPSHDCGGITQTRAWAGYMIDQPAGAQARAMAWLAHSYRATGDLYWMVDWKMDTAWTDQYDYTGNGDGTLFYAYDAARVGGNDPVPIESIRLKRIRDGYEDYEYLSFLQANGRGSVADAEARALFLSPYETGQSDSLMQEARLRLAREIVAIVGGPMP